MIVPDPVKTYHGRVRPPVFKHEMVFHAKRTLTWKERFLALIGAELNIDVKVLLENKTGGFSPSVNVTLT